MMEKKFHDSALHRGPQPISLKKKLLSLITLISKTNWDTNNCDPLSLNVHQLCLSLDVHKLNLSLPTEN